MPTKRAGWGGRAKRPFAVSWLVNHLAGVNEVDAAALGGGPRQEWRLPTPST